MRLLMIFLYVLGPNYSQASGQENSTKVYYAVLTIEKSAIPNITNLLEAFIKDVRNNNRSINVHVKDLQVTTECKILENYAQCTCRKKHVWSTQVCASNTSCCAGATTCVFQTKSPPMCFPNTRVTVTGSLRLPGEQYFDSLADPNSPKFRELSEELEEQMKRIYSTFVKFDGVKITKLRRGSVIADFEMNVNSPVSTADLTDKTLKLQKAINGTFSLETTGLVDISLHNPVRYNDRTKITCCPTEVVDPNAEWKLKKIDENSNIQVFDITNGLESKLTPSSTSASVTLHHATEIWAGEITCAFSPLSSSVPIVHKASAKLDVALLPQIYISADPQFPRCAQSSTEKVAVKVSCEIRRSSENYTVTWLSEGNHTEVKEQEYHVDGIYTADTTVGCLEEKANLVCKFGNRLSQEKNAIFNIYVIDIHSNYCKAAEDWPDVKAGYTGKLRCHGQSGERFRRCFDNGTWEDEKSYCVNQDLYSILQDTENLAKGLGSVDSNAAGLFSRLSNSTNKTERINTFANVDASVTILSKMKELKQTFKQTILNDFIQASSNILGVSPEKSWNAQSDSQGNVSVAVRYLDSVEGLIELTNITDTLNRSTSNIQLMSCSAQKSHCKNTVFNVTVSMEKSLSGIVKTAGFRHLANYLPNKETNENEPNSIVVSTTIQSNTTSSRVIELDFHLIKERPRNHEIQCVYWDMAAKEWSSVGCEWGGANNEGHCKCHHLSSFTILMSKTPKYIPFLDQITYTGLGVSIISLVLCLAIEALVWNSITKTKVLYLRHTAHVNITLSLLVADCSFLASSFPEKITENWCQILVALKHFCFLSMFFWMLCLSTILLHQTIFIFHDLSRKRYLGFSFFLGYVCPALIVATTYISYDSGKKDIYYSTDSCWLVYKGLMKGSIHAFIIPVGIIVVVNVFCMAVVIMKLLDHPKAATVKSEDDKKSAKSILRAIVLLTPIFGMTWIIGFAVLIVDLTVGTFATLINYAFTILNAFQPPSTSESSVTNTALKEK